MALISGPANSTNAANSTRGSYPPQGQSKPPMRALTGAPCSPSSPPVTNPSVTRQTMTEGGKEAFPNLRTTRFHALSRAPYQNASGATLSIEHPTPRF